MTIKKAIPCAAALLLASLASRVNAATVVLNFGGSGVSGSLELTYGPSTDAKYPQAYEVTSISGWFSDTNNGLNLVNVPVGPLEPVKNDTPEALNLLAPHDFSRFAVASGLDPISNGFLTYSNLYYPGGSPQTASDYPLHGGVLDIYGLMFSIGGGRVVDFWSNGTLQGTGGGPIYGVAVASHDQAFDYVGGVMITPEPSTIALLSGGLLAFVVSRRRLARKA